MKKKNNKKLRQTEYYSQQDLWDKLYEKSSANGNFTNLIKYIIHPNNIKLAYRNIKANPGSKTAGTDNKTVIDYKKLSEEDIINMVQKNINWYKPNSIRRVYIPKPNGKRRPLGIPTFRDRLIQQCIKQILEPICEAKFHKDSYGFRPNRGTRHAIARTYHILQRAEMSYVVNVDIKNFFDNVNHNKLIRQMYHLGIQDKKLLCIIKNMLKVEIKNEGIQNSGTPQGGILSPLLSNIVLNELDWWISSQFEGLPTRRQYVNNNVKLRNLKGAKQSNKLKPMYIVRYADDFKIFCENEEHAIKIYEATKMWIKERLYLDISTEKSGITNSKTNYFEFLGIKIRLIKKGYVTRYDNPDKNVKQKTKWVVKSHLTDNNINKIISEYKIRIKNIQKAKNRIAELNKMNFFIYQTHRYYEVATHVVEDFHYIEYQTLYSTKHRLIDMKSKNGVISPSYAKIYRTSKRVRYYSGIALLPIGYVQHVSPKQFSSEITPFSKEGRVLIHNNLRNDIKSGIDYMLNNPIYKKSIEYNDNRISKYSAQKGKDAVFGIYIIPNCIHCHHIIPLSLGGNDDFNNLIILDKVTHMLVHSTKIETINKLLVEIIDKMNFENLELKELNINKLNKYRVIVGNKELSHISNEQGWIEEVNFI